jgi:hypothetical protein
MYNQKENESKNDKLKVKLNIVSENSSVIWKWFELNTTEYRYYLFVLQACKFIISRWYPLCFFICSGKTNLELSEIFSLNSFPFSKL